MAKPSKALVNPQKGPIKALVKARVASCQVGEALPSGGFKYMTAVVAPSGRTMQVDTGRNA